MHPLTYRDLLLPTLCQNNLAQGRIRGCLALLVPQESCSRLLLLLEKQEGLRAGDRFYSPLDHSLEQSLPLSSESHGHQHLPEVFGRGIQGCTLEHLYPHTSLAFVLLALAVTGPCAVGFCFAPGCCSTVTSVTIHGSLRK